VALAHELKAPLGLIRHLALARDYYSETERDTAFRRIELAAERSLRLIETLARSHRRFELDSEPINLSCLCEEVAHELLPLARETSRTIELKLPRQPLLAVGNREILGSVLFGLCDNAFAYAEAGQPILIHTSQRKNDARVAVSDQGPGINKKQLGEIAARLGKAPQTISNRPGSSGLGLYIAGQFATAMQGRFGVKQSRVGAQSFYIDLPRSRQLSLMGV
jgi:signal transduction histidine kinase